MNQKDIFEVITLIDDDLIAEAYASVKKVRHIKMRKVIVIAAALIMLLGVTVWAANILLGSREGHSYNTPDYTSVPSKEQLQSDTGISPNLPENFSNGYAFDSSSITYNEDFDTKGNSVEKFKGLSCTYHKDGAEIFLTIDAAMAGIQLRDPEKLDTHKGSDILYYSYKNKLVPPDYRPTEEDKKAEQDGSVILSYGSQDIKLCNVQGVALEYQGLNYEFVAIDVDIDKEELLQMAKEMIDFQEVSEK